VSVQTVSLLRDRSRDDSGRVAMVELFFDLVFVFAVTQLSHHLLEHLNPAGVVQTLLMFLALWWLWIFTTWTTNWLDPERVPVRLMLFALMLGGLMLSSSIPQAFAERGLAFAVAFAAMQLFRTAFMVFAFARHGRPDQTRNYARILVWLLASTVLWVLGGLAEPAARLGWWTAAVALEYAGPIAYFRVPGLGRSRTESWDVEGRHIAERCALFVIIALGESLLITGATFADARWTAVTLAAFATALLGSIAMWWIYFDTGADRASRRIARSGDPGRLARLAYTYLHLPIAAGIIVTAVADELVLAHPLHAENAAIATILGGPALYLLGTTSFKWATNERRLPPLSHLAGLLLLCALAPFAFAHLLSALALGAITTAILMLVATWETIALRGTGPGRAES
jgi:low temperature requirement protein LtrA